MAHEDGIMESRGRPFLDRLLRPVAPRPVASFVPGAHELARDVWLLDRQLRFPGGARLPCRTTVIRLGSGGLVVLSAPPLPGDALDGIGAVEQVVVPNTFHYVYATALATRYPAARVLVAPGVRERVPELAGAEELSPTPPAAWSDELDLEVLGPVRGLCEVIFFHRATRSLILTDLAFHLVHYPRALDRIVWRAGGMPSGFGPGRTSRALLLRDRAEASRCLGEVARWPFEKIIPAHGEVIERDARARFLRAFGPYLDGTGQPLRSLPPDVLPYRRTREFTRTTIPRGLRQRHATKPGVWARIRVLEGSLRFLVLEPEALEEILSPERPGIVGPEVPHQVEPLGEVRFFVEFFRPGDRRAEPPVS